MPEFLTRVGEYEPRHQRLGPKLDLDGGGHSGTEACWGLCVSGCGE